MSNENCLEGMRCPRCGEFEPFKIEVTGVVEMFDDGNPYDAAGLDWEDSSYCHCPQCNFTGVVADFQRTGPLLPAMEEAFWAHVPESIEGYSGRIQMLIDLLTPAQLEKACEIVGIEDSEYEDESEGDEEDTSSLASTNAGEECPVCKSGTVEIVDGCVTCKGECGAWVLQQSDESSESEGDSE